jgi:lysophospholipase L1-like esterase
VASSSPYTHVALGDSTSVGYGAPPGAGYVDHVFEELRAREPAARLVRLGRNGATAGAVAARQLAPALAERPAFATLSVGGNDLWRGVPLATTREHLLDIGRRLAEAEVAVVVSNLADLSCAPVARLAEQQLGLPRALVRQRVGDVNAVIAEVAARYGLHLYDLHDATWADLADRPEYFCADGFHPSALGYRAWADGLRPIVAAAYRPRPELDAVG